MKLRWWDNTVRNIRQRFHYGWNRWLDHRIPRAGTIYLTRKNVFIFLTPAGFVYLLFMVVMLLTAINYRNNMVFALTFLMAGIFVIAIHHTHAYLSGIRVLAGTARPVFAGQMAVFELVLVRDGARIYPAVELAFAGGEPQLASITGSEQRVRLYVRLDQRGLVHAPRLRLENRYPLGLLRAWSWVDLGMQCLVYPKPVPAGVPESAGGVYREGHAREEQGMDDFRQLRDYQPGDSLKHVAWKTWAKGQPLQTRQYQTVVHETCILDWEQFHGQPVEERLSRLCYQVLEADRQGRRYGLRLPGLAIPPAQGVAHRHECLQALALFDARGIA